MPRKCTICGHKEKEAINKVLLEGEPFRRIAGRFGTSATALQRHKKEHMPIVLTRARAAREVTRSDSLLDQLEEIRLKAWGLLNQAEAAGDLRTALQGIGQARACIELLAKIRGELAQEGAANITISAEWIELRQVILQTLEPYPEAVQKLSDALGRVTDVSF